MPILNKDGKKHSLYMGDRKPVNLYYGSTKVAGWRNETKSGEVVSFATTYNDNASVEVAGNSTQVVTLQGKNLFSKYEVGTTSRCTVEIIGNEIVCTPTQKMNTTAQSNAVLCTFLLKANVRYSISCIIRPELYLDNTTIDATQLRLAYSSSGATIRYSSTSSIVGVDTLVKMENIIVNSDTLAYLQLYLNSPTALNTVYTAKAYLKNLQIEVGDTTTAYEPFIPNSPSPDYPSTITSAEGFIKVNANNVPFEDADLNGVADGWTVGGTGRSFSNGVQRIDSLTSSTLLRRSMPRTIGNKYYYRLHVKTNNSSVNLNNGYVAVPVRVLNEWTTISWVSISSATSAPHVGTYCTPNANTYGEFKNPLLIDMGTIGSPLYNKTLAEMDAMFSSTTPLPIIHKVGSVADTYNSVTGVLTRRVGVRIFNGTEGWAKENYNLYTSFKSFGSNNCDVIMCSHFTNAKLSENLVIGTFRGSGYSPVYGTYNGNLLFNFNGSTAVTVTEFKAWLAAQYAAGTPVTVYYELATPTTEQYAPNLIPTYYPTTVIETTATAKPTITATMKVEE